MDEGPCREGAVSYLEEAMSLVPQPPTERWEATVVNLAHAHRKLNNFDDAIAWRGNETKPSPPYHAPDGHYPPPLPTWLCNSLIFPLIGGLFAVNFP